MCMAYSISKTNFSQTSKEFTHSPPPLKICPLVIVHLTLLTTVSLSFSPVKPSPPPPPPNKRTNPPPLPSPPDQPPLRQPLALCHLTLPPTHVCPLRPLPRNYIVTRPTRRLPPPPPRVTILDTKRFDRYFTVNLLKYRSKMPFL